MRAQNRTWWAWKVVAVRGIDKVNQQDVGGRCTSRDKEEGTYLPLRVWPPQGKVTHPDRLGFVIGKNKVANFMAGYILTSL